MKNLIRKLFGRPAELPVLSVTVPAPAGPARIATPAEQRIAEAAIVLANARQREALVQCAAVAVAWIEAIDRRKAADAGPVDNHLNGGW